MVCTDDHRILTHNGWEKAQNLEVYDRVGMLNPNMKNDLSDIEDDFGKWALTPYGEDGGAIRKMINGFGINIIKKITKLNEEKKVYDLSVENHHEFFANLICVSNCIDATRYSLEAIRRTVKARENPALNMSVEPRTNYWNKGR